MTKRSFGIAWSLFVVRTRTLGLLLVIAIANVLSSLLVSSAAEAPTSDKLELIPENESLWKESLLWDKDVVLRAGFGYKDNVLLSPDARQGSGFVTSGLDVTIIRLPLDGWQLSFNLTGDDVRYFRKPGGLAGEDLFLSSLEMQKYLGGSWRVGGELRYTYVDQVLEELLDVGGAQAIEAKGNLIGLRPFVRRDLSTNWWVQVELPVNREWWQAPLDAAWRYGSQVVVGLDYGRHSHVSLSGGVFRVEHDTWLARDTAGNDLGTRLALWREMAELKWEHQWDREEHWATVTRAGFNHSHDNGGGYFDFYRYYASETLRFRDKDWEFKLTGALSYLDFPIQTIADAGGPTLHLVTANASFRAERRIYKGLRCFGSYEFEQTSSNDNSSQYHYHVLLGGLSWEF